MLTLSAVFATRDSEATIHYQGLNEWNEPLLMARLALDAAAKVYPKSAYSSLSRDGQRLNLILGASPRPCDREVEFAVVALFERVPCRARATGALRMALPVQEWNGYDLPDPNVAAELVHVRQILLHVDIVVESAARVLRPAPQAPNLWSVGGPRIRYSVELTPEIPLPVLKRSDEFPRS